MKIKQILSHVEHEGKEYTRYQVEKTDYVYWYEGLLNPYDVANLEHCEARQVQPPLFGLLNRLFHGTEPKLKLYEDKYIIEVYDSSAIYFSESKGNLYGGAYSTRKSDAKRYDEYHSAYDMMLVCLREIQLSNEFYVGAVCKITVKMKQQDELHGDNIPEG